MGPIGHNRIEAFAGGPHTGTSSVNSPTPCPVGRRLPRVLHQSHPTSRESSGPQWWPPRRQWSGSRRIVVVVLFGCRVKPRRRSHTTARELQTCTFQGPALQKPHQNSTERPPREGEKRMKIVAGEGKKARKFGPPTLRGPTGAPPLGAPPSGPPPFGAHLFQVWAPTFRGPPGSRPTPFAHHSRFGLMFFLSHLPIFILSRQQVAFFVPFPFFLSRGVFCVPGPDTLVSQVAGSESEASSDTETDESDRESVQSIIRQEEEEVPEAIMTLGIKEGLTSLDTVDMCHLFSMRAMVMKSPPKFLRGAYRSALRIALREICEGAAQHDETRQTCGWKLLVLLPRMVLFRPPRGGLIPRQRLFDRFVLFNQGSWIQLLIEGRECCEASMNAVRRRRRTTTDSIERRAERAQMMVMMSEVSSGRQVLEGAPLAPMPR